VRVRVETGSRLHFGPLGLHAPIGEGGTERSFGGVGLMIDRPGFELTVEPSPEADGLDYSGPLCGRATVFAARFLSSLPSRPKRPPYRMTIHRAPPEHAGLGSGTQLGLAVGAALTAYLGLPEMPSTELAVRTGRGLRSSVGLHGFTAGGLLVEAGKRRASDLSPLVSRMDFPPDWRLVLVRPPAPAGLSGEIERRAFRELPPASDATTDRLCRLVLMGLLPSAAEGDLPGFSSALYEMQRIVGEFFRPAQGGVYSAPGAEAVVEWFRRRGVTGVGQSSWGPTLYAVVEDPARAEALAADLRRDLGESAGEIIIAAALNRGAGVSVGA
jgi:beta-RFAP synthase